MRLPGASTELPNPRKLASLRYQFQHIWGGLARAIAWPIPFPRVDQIEDVDAQVAHYLVGGLQRKGAFSVQDMVHVGLGDADHPSQGAFGEFAAANALAEQGNESLLELAKCHDGPSGIFPGEIGGRQISVRRFRESTIKQNEFTEPEFLPSGLRLIGLLVRQNP